MTEDRRPSHEGKPYHPPETLVEDIGDAPAEQMFYEDLELYSDYLRRDGITMETFGLDQQGRVTDPVDIYRPQIGSKVDSDPNESAFSNISVEDGSVWSLISERDSETGEPILGTDELVASCIHDPQVIDMYLEQSDDIRHQLAPTDRETRAKLKELFSHEAIGQAAGQYLCDFYAHTREIENRYRGIQRRRSYDGLSMQEQRVLVAEATDTKRELYRERSKFSEQLARLYSVAGISHDYEGLVQRTSLELLDDEGAEEDISEMLRKSRVRGIGDVLHKHRELATDVIRQVLEDDGSEEAQRLLNEMDTIGIVNTLEKNIHAADMIYGLATERSDEESETFKDLVALSKDAMKPIYEQKYARHIVPAIRDLAREGDAEARQFLEDYRRSTAARKIIKGFFDGARTDEDMRQLLLDSAFCIFGDESDSGRVYMLDNLFFCGDILDTESRYANLLRRLTASTDRDEQGFAYDYFQSVYSLPIYTGNGYNRFVYNQEIVDRGNAEREIQYVPVHLLKRFIERDFSESARRADNEAEQLRVISAEEVVADLDLDAATLTERDVIEIRTKKRETCLDMAEQIRGYRYVHARLLNESPHVGKFVQKDQDTATKKSAKARDLLKAIEEFDLDPVAQDVFATTYLFSVYGARVVVDTKGRFHSPPENPRPGLRPIKPEEIAELRTRGRAGYRELTKSQKRAVTQLTEMHNRRNNLLSSKNQALSAISRRVDKARQTTLDVTGLYMLEPPPVHKQEEFAQVVDGLDGKIPSIPFARRPLRNRVVRHLEDFTRELGKDFHYALYLPHGVALALPGNKVVPYDPESPTADVDLRKQREEVREILRGYYDVPGNKPYEFSANHRDVSTMLNHLREHGLTGEQKEELRDLIDGNIDSIASSDYFMNQGGVRVRLADDSVMAEHGVKSIRIEPLRTKYVHPDTGVTSYPVDFSKHVVAIETGEFTFFMTLDEHYHLQGADGHGLNLEDDAKLYWQAGITSVIRSIVLNENAQANGSNGKEGYDSGSERSENGNGEKKLRGPGKKRLRVGAQPSKEALDRGLEPRYGVNVRAINESLLRQELKRPSSEYTYYRMDENAVDSDFVLPRSLRDRLQKSMRGGDIDGFVEDVMLVMHMYDDTNYGRTIGREHDQSLVDQIYGLGGTYQQVGREVLVRMLRRLLPVMESQGLAKRTSQLFTFQREEGYSGEANGKDMQPRLVEERFHHSAGLRDVFGEQ